MNERTIKAQKGNSYIDKLVSRQRKNRKTEQMMSRIIDRILCRSDFIERPPVLLDIGASGELNPKWKLLAKHSVCIAFDADEREISHIEMESSHFKKLHVFNAVLTDKAKGKIPFYLTNSPFCSSSLKPDNQSLENWFFADLFEVERRVELNSIDLPQVLKKLEIEYVDWFKTDSQGTDLRLFKSLGNDLSKRVLVAEFEPGFIDAYQGEDKLYDVLAFMDKLPFWMIDIQVHGTQRIKRATVHRHFNKKEQRLMSELLKMSPGWAEVAFINTLQQDAIFTEREFLLGWIFATLYFQHGHALELALKAAQKYGDSIFEELSRVSTRQVKDKYRILPLLKLERIGKVFLDGLRKKLLDES